MNGSSPRGRSRHASTPGRVGAQERALEGEVARFGDFVLTDVIGRGGMATVVGAKSPSYSGLPETVALKFLDSSMLDDPNALDAFREEGRLGMRLRHPAFCRSFGYEAREGRVAIVMERVEGITLSALFPTIDQGGDTQSQLCVAYVLTQVLHALAELHSATDDLGARLDAVHRDVSPQNILVTPAGEAKLIDLGVAFHRQRNFRSAEGIVKGKLAYCAPEYLLGRRYDHRADVWSAGVVLWEMLTGRRLFRAQGTRSTAQLVATAVVPPAMAVARCPSALSDVVGSALERDPDDRLPSASTFARTLERLLQAHAPSFGPAAVARWMRERVPNATSGYFPRSQGVQAEPASDASTLAKGRV